MNISVILCTYNRSQDLARALRSLAASKLPGETDWEVLVVDNNSNDRTRETVEEFVQLYPGRFRYAFEGKPGKSYALNTGILEAQGDMLAFVDDDVTVDSNWLQSLASPLGRGHCVGVGGRVLPDPEARLPGWINLGDRYAVGPLVIFDLGAEASPLKEAPFGTNMAFKKEVFGRHGGFRTGSGPQPGSEIRGEDSEFVLRLLAAGERLQYAPSAVVYHSVSQHRLRKEYFLAWWFDKGRSDIRTLEKLSKRRWSVAGIPLVLVRKLVLWTLRWFAVPSSTRRFNSKLTVWYLAGQIRECYEQRVRAGSNEGNVRKHFQAQQRGGNV